MGLISRIVTIGAISGYTGAYLQGYVPALPLKEMFTGTVAFINDNWAIPDEVERQGSNPQTPHKQHTRNTVTPSHTHTPQGRIVAPEDNPAPMPVDEFVSYLRNGVSMAFGMLGTGIKLAEQVQQVQEQVHSTRSVTVASPNEKSRYHGNEVTAEEAHPGEVGPQGSLRHTRTRLAKRWGGFERF
eukprot:TRINITY_DN25810_c0_g1_i1.p1 TRINITY_DN25810_c0_g1~~TRINITY_DN25810_c0_g1_i1.p1  ORF type:complete len:185 (+),score=27.03 TRINITY_DN25810_c0_g1_i1:227-781(+)